MVYMFLSCALLTNPVFLEEPEAPEIPLVKLTVDDVTLIVNKYAVMRHDTRVSEVPSTDPALDEKCACIQTVSSRVCPTDKSDTTTCFTIERAV